MRLTLVNTGAHVWDPARVHLSYHWLWLIPRELALRSRTLPYQEGVRTELPAMVAPGARVELSGRLLAPVVPGAYWLQWDMVEEGVTWFAQVAPRARRQLVIVVPPPGELFAPLPLAVAIAGLVATGRASSPALVSFAAAADVWWCAATLFSKQLLLVSDALLEPTIAGYGLAAGVSLAIPMAAMLALPRRRRPWVLLGIGMVAALIVLGDIVYFRFFGDVLSAAALLGAKQTGQLWGSIRRLLPRDLLWLLVDLPVAVWLAVRATRMPARTTWRARTASAGMLVLIGVAGATVVPRVLASARVEQMFRNRAIVEQFGPFGYHAYDAWNYLHATWLRPAATASEIDAARAWFAARAPLRAGGRYFGAAAGKNLIVIQVESLQDFVVDYEIGGQEVMPHLRRWDSLRFTNVTDQTGEGRTSDAEFAAMTSLLPLDHGAVAFRYPENHYVALPRVLADRGYSTLSAVAFEAGFWNRRVTHPAYGFRQSLFEPDFQLTEQIGWGLNDRDFLRQMLPRVEALQRPFAAWLITLSLHHPFDNFPDHHKVMKLGALEGTSFGNYLHTMRFFDEALHEFTSALARDGLLDQTVMAVFGDHDAGFPRDQVSAAAMRIAATDLGWELADRVPFFVRVPGIAVTDARAGAPAGQTDFAPTLLALLGVDPAPLPYVGRNLIGEPDGPPLLRPYGDWLDASHVFITHGGASRADMCYDIVIGHPADGDEACAATNEAARQAREISRIVVTGDLQVRLVRR